MDRNSNNNIKNNNTGTSKKYSNSNRKGKYLMVQWIFLA